MDKVDTNKGHRKENIANSTDINSTLQAICRHHMDTAADYTSTFGERVCRSKINITYSIFLSTFLTSGGVYFCQIYAIQTRYIMK